MRAIELIQAFIFFYQKLTNTLRAFDLKLRMISKQVTRCGIPNEMMTSEKIQNYDYSFHFEVRRWLGGQVLDWPKVG